jgi:hypothetical protein
MKYTHLRQLIKENSPDPSPNAKPTPNDGWKRELSSMVKDDQAKRKKYQDKYLAKHKDYRDAAAAWCKDTGASPDNIFGDNTPAAKRLIQQNSDQLFQDPELTNTAWILAQHADSDRDFQKWFLDRLDPRSDNYKYLHDRLEIAAGRKQKYGTQNEDL